MSHPAQDATQTDALEQLESQTSGATDETGADEVVVSPRMAAMEAIAAQRRDSLAADGVDMTRAEPEKPDPEKKPAVEDTPSGDDQLAAQLGQDDKPVQYADPSTRVKVKVDGEEIELPLAEVVKSYQKDAAASKRLQEATRLMQIAEQAANKVAHGNDHADNSPATDVAKPEEKELRVGRIKGIFSKLYEGDEEGAAEEMEQLIAQGAGVVAPATQQQTIDPNQIAAEVKQQLAFDSAYGEVQTDYPALFSNDERGVVLGSATAARMQAKSALGVPRDQALRESAEEVASLFGIEKAGRQQAAPQRTARDTKLERKANLDLPVSANVVAGGKAAPAEAPNVSSVIAEMAAARLGQSLTPK